ncbi:hypothetical protein pEaSNUABM6_00105 [Erwinia phage pEa_SNUABM_6]|nr:hypothetical protein pEaSNUABM6_00105 [Erwinia phage pEa_SNUABM_6]
MKLLQTRVRTVLIPASGLLNAIPKLPNMVLNEENRKLLINSMLEERTWITYRTMPAGYTPQNPPYVGQTLHLLKSMYRYVNQSDALYAIQALGNAVHKLLNASYGRTPIDYPETGSDTGFPGGGHIFDHGVAYRWYKGYVHAKWPRPVVNMQEMAVASFWLFIRDAVGDKKILDRPISELMETVDINDLLSDTNYDFLERCLCSTSK